MIQNLLSSNATTISSTLNAISHVKQELQTPLTLPSFYKATLHDRITYLRSTTDSAHQSLTTLAMKIDLDPDCGTSQIQKREWWVLWLLQKRTLDTMEKRMKEVEGLFGALKWGL